MKIDPLCQPIQLIRLFLRIVSRDETPFNPEDDAFFDQIDRIVRTLFMESLY